MHCGREKEVKFCISPSHNAMYFLFIPRIQGCQLSGIERKSPISWIFFPSGVTKPPASQIYVSKSTKMCAWMDFKSRLIIVFLFVCLFVFFLFVYVFVLFCFVFLLYSFFHNQNIISLRCKCQFFGFLHHSILESWQLGRICYFGD